MSQIDPVLSQIDPVLSQMGDEPRPPTSSMAVTTSDSARQRRKIAQLEQKLQVLESGQAMKQRYAVTDSYI
jgi:hypothetical protein